MTAFLHTVQAGAETTVVRLPPPPAAPTVASLDLSGYRLYGEIIPSFMVQNLPGAVGRVSGNFSATPLAGVVYTIVPAGYRIYTSGKVNMKAPVYWRGTNVGWVDALAAVARAQSLAITVDGANQAVLIKPNPGAPGLGGIALTNPQAKVISTSSQRQPASAQTGPVASPAYPLPTREDPPVRGFGSGVPLEKALAMVVPASWGVALEPPVAFNEPVSWSGDQPWRQVVRQIALGAGYDAEFEEGKQIVRLSAPWVLRAGEEYHDELSDWARVAGWKLVWRLDHDWKVPADAMFRGSFTQVVEQIVNALHSQGVPVGARIWGNRVVEVFEQGRAAQ